MKKMFSQDSGILRLLTLLADLMIISVLWILGCIPVVTAGASTTAMYACVMKLRREGEISCVKEFWAAFRKNFVQASILWLVVVLLAATVAADLYLVFFTDFEPGTVVKMAMLVLAAVVMMILSYVFPLQAFFVNTVRQMLKNAVLFAIMYLPVSVVIMVLQLVPVLAWLLIPGFFSRTLFLWVALSPGVIAYVCAGMFQRMFQRHITEE